MPSYSYNAGFKIMSKRSILLFISIAVFSVAAFAQGGTENPFDLIPRIKAEAAAKRAAGEGAYIPANPFDIVRKTETLPTIEETAALNISEQEREYINVAAEKESFLRFFFIAFLSMLLLLTLTFIIFRTAFLKVWRAFLNDNILTQIHREQGAVAHLPYLLMNLLFCTNLALFILLSLRHSDIRLDFATNQGAFFAVLGGTLLVFCAKHLLLKVVAAVFPLRKELKLYAFTITVFCAILGLFLIPLNLFLAYAPDEVSRFAFWLTVAVFGLTYLFRSLRGFIIGGRYVGSHLFHFLLYICSVEIAPAILLVKYLSSI